MIGPITFSATETTPSESTSTTPTRSGRRRPTSRRAEGPKSIAFSTGCPAPPHGGPPPRRWAAIPRAAATVSASCRGLAGALIALPRWRSVERFAGAVSMVRSLHPPTPQAPQAPPAAVPRSPSPHQLPLRVLGLDDLDVGGAARQQLRVRALADDQSVVEHHDLVGVGDGRHALGHDHHGGVGRDGLERS